MRSLISRHNSRLLSGAGPGAGAGAAPEQVDPCVCRDFPCPLNGNCEIRNCVYEATVTSNDGKIENYIGVTKHFKQRFVGHRGDFNRPGSRNSSTLSNYIWTLKDDNKQFNIDWQIIDRGPIYNSITKKCFACIREKYHIFFGNPSLNKRNELFNTCRHRLLETLSKKKR